MEEEGKDTEIQVASFHPQYQFAGTSAESVENWTNRSPFPMIHLLRVADVRSALKKFSGDTDDIWCRNQEQMRTLGACKIQNINAKISSNSNDENFDFDAENNLQL